jgi:superfamily II RNA helicase
VTTARPDPALNLLLDSLEDAGGPDAFLDLFLEWVTSTGRDPYPHQEEAILALSTGAHVVLATPTGSGKSLVALGALTYALSEGRPGFYTAPIKALVSEKFFELVALFGADNVGMVTGDSAINPDAPIICCTAEILANLALREGADGPSGDATVVMDEFHFYADPQRGWAWQVPLLEMTRAQMLLMSATLGDVTELRDDLARRTGREVAVVDDAERPVPLSHTWSVQPLQDLLTELTSTHRAPAYVVHFSQKDAVTRAQSLTSVKIASREQRDQVAEAIGSFRFGPGFGATLSGLLRKGIGVHHAGMLPRYRRLVERLAQSGLLPVICGTDTLGVGINVPIRTVVLTSLTKFDGERMRHLTAREFHQIAGRAGRAGFDTSGEVITQAPDHEIENARLLARAGDDEAKKKRIVRKKPAQGLVNWTEKTHDRLVAAAPERLVAQMEVTHSMLLALLARPGDPVAAAYRLLTDNHAAPSDRNPLVRRAIEIYRSLRAAGVVEHRDAAWRRAHPREPYVRLTLDLPKNFALTAPLAPFALAAMDLLDPEDPLHSLDAISIVESTLEDPRPVLYGQERAARGEAIAAMKAEGVEYEERMERVDEITWPRPLEETLNAALATYRQTNPWVADLELKPKSVVREMVENAMTFSELISRYDIGRSEGVVLRYLTDAYRALRQVLPDRHRTDEVTEIVDWLGAMIRAVDSSLLDEWAALADGTVDPGDESAADRAIGGLEEPRLGADEDGNVALSRNPHAFRAAVTRATSAYVRQLANDNADALARLAAGSGWDEHAAAPAPLTDSSPRTADDFADVLDALYDAHEWISTGPDAVGRDAVEVTEDVDDADLIRARVDVGKVPEPDARRWWLVRQTLVDDADERDFALTAVVDVKASDEAGRVVLTVLSITAA